MTQAPLVFTPETLHGAGLVPLADAVGAMTDGDEPTPILGAAWQEWNEVVRQAQDRLIADLRSGRSDGFVHRAGTDHYYRIPKAFWKFAMADGALSGVLPPIGDQGTVPPALVGLPVYVRCMIKPSAEMGGSTLPPLVEKPRRGRPPGTGFGQQDEVRARLLLTRRSTGEFRSDKQAAEKIVHEQGVLGASFPSDVDRLRKVARRIQLEENGG